MQFYADLVSKYGVAPTPGYRHCALGWELFIAGRVATIHVGSGATAARDNLTFNWDVIPSRKGGGTL